MNALKNAGRAVGYWLLRGMLAVMPLIPLRHVQALGRRLGDVLCGLSRRRRTIAAANLEYAYGDALSRPERERIIRECFRHFGMFVLETMKVATMPNQAVAELVTIHPDAARTITTALESGSGVIFVSAHYGNFEMAARWVALHGHEVMVVARAARDRRTNELMTRLRKRNGMEAIRRDLAGRPMLATLRKGGCVAILADQNADDLIVPFFGKPTGTVDGPARLAIHTGAPIVVALCSRMPNGHFELAVEGVVEADRTAERSKEVLRITAMLNEMIEGAVRRHPEQWLWFHNRWRSSPGGGFV